MKHKILFLPLLAAAALALSACGPAPEPEQSLEDRVVARWQHMIERDFEAAWEYFAPGFRQTTPREVYVAEIASRPIRWQEAELLALECETERCNVRVKVTYQVIGGPAALRSMRVPSEAQETWLKLDGNWWYSRN